MILIASSNRLLAEGISYLLSEARLNREIKIFFSVNELLNDVKNHLAAILILVEPFYSSMKSEIIDTLVGTSPTLRIIVMQRHSSVRFPFQLYRQGVLAVLCHRCTAEDLWLAVTHASQARCYVPQSIANTLACEEYDATEPHVELTDCEFQIFMLLIEGLSIRRISASQSLSPQKVIELKTAILQKLGAVSLGDLIRYAIEHSILEHKPI